MTKLIVSRQKKQIKYFRENLNGVILEMAHIPSGTFLMGAPETEKESLDRERPQHSVNISSFFIGRYPITQAQWRAIASLAPIEKELKKNPSRFQGDNHPVESIYWQDAIEFCARLSDYTQKNYRLPTEAEWEYAARAGTTTPYHFGESLSTQVANYNGKQTTDVKHFGVANEFGLSDMHGNVWEWCLDPWHKNYENAPTNGSVWDEENKKDNRYQNIFNNIKVLIRDQRGHVLRGGPWNTDAWYCRSASRLAFVVGNFDNGFRVVCAPK